MTECSAPNIIQTKCMYVFCVSKKCDSDANANVNFANANVSQKKLFKFEITTVTSIHDLYVIGVNICYLPRINIAVFCN